MSLSDFLRNMIVQGMIAENALDIEQRMRAIIGEMQLRASSGGQAALPDAALLSLFTSEALLTAIVEARNVQDLYSAQDRAKCQYRIDTPHFCRSNFPQFSLAACDAVSR